MCVISSAKPCHSFQQWLALGSATPWHHWLLDWGDPSLHPLPSLTVLPGSCCTWGAGPAAKSNTNTYFCVMGVENRYVLCGSTIRVLNCIDEEQCRRETLLGDFQLCHSSAAQGLKLREMPVSYTYQNPWRFVFSPYFPLQLCSSVKADIPVYAYAQAVNPQRQQMLPWRKPSSEIKHEIFIDRNWMASLSRYWGESCPGAGGETGRAAAGARGAAAGGAELLGTRPRLLSALGTGKQTWHHPARLKRSLASSNRTIGDGR